MAIFGITTRYVWFAVPFTGYFIGKYLDDQETLRMTNFRDKSALYGGRVKEGDPPSWPFEAELCCSRSSVEFKKVDGDFNRLKSRTQCALGPRVYKLGLSCLSTGWGNWGHLSPRGDFVNVISRKAEDLESYFPTGWWYLQCTLV
ncbi:MNLL subunit domain-containing protein [Phthorimaea operculella]|nr:MNLL subunit domain-containing protein [Phthorimaea operculella]